MPKSSSPASQATITNPLRSLRDNAMVMSGGHPSYYVLVSCSTIIAAYGLLANSTAVVIGAMLVAPLMGPILGIALGLATGDRPLTMQALKVEVAGALVAVGLAFLVGLVPLNLGLGSEVMARTQPTIYDLIVALAAGAVGAYAMLNERVSTSLPGVAIAVALVPPLATCGVCLGADRADLAQGAALLFLANLVAIQTAASGVFVLSGLRHGRYEVPHSLAGAARRFGLSVTALVVVGVLMTRTFLGLIADQHLEQEVRRRLVAALSQTAGTQLQTLKIDRATPTIAVVAVVLTPQPVTSRQIAAMESGLRQGVDDRLRLMVRSLSSNDADSRGPVYTLSTAAEKPPKPSPRALLLKQVSDILAEQLRGLPNAELVSLSRGDDVGQPHFVADVRTSQVIEPAQVSACEQRLAEATGQPVTLVVRSVLARVATAHGFVDPDREPEPTPAERAVLDRLRAAMTSQLASRQPGATVSSLRLDRRPDGAVVNVEVSTPHTVEPATVAAIQHDLRVYVQPGLRLLVRSVLNPVATPEGFVRQEPTP